MLEKVHLKKNIPMKILQKKYKKKKMFLKKNGIEQSLIMIKRHNKKDERVRKKSF